ncbi:MAG: polysaccharide pyruvyl transferase family protein [Elusimicrobia bacterium]|nr:polysaccharide pyruvyl transferase family protein [Elusimicrobiota bacterium]
MQQKVFNIFVPEYVPVANKGELAIVLGMIDSIFPNEEVKVHILDMNCKKVYSIDNVVVYPAQWFLPSWRYKEFKLGFSLENIIASICSVFRKVLYILFPNWIKKPQNNLKYINKILQKYKNKIIPKNYKEQYLYDLFQCDYILAGHNGGLNVEVCHILDLFYKYDFHFGVYGSSLKPRVKKGALIEIFDNILSKADFVYVRNNIALQWANKYLNKVKAILAPDPAFCMQETDEKEMNEVLKENKLDSFFDNNTIVMTVCEPAPISRYSFLETKDFIKKQTLHRQLLASLINHITKNTDAKILFLPHSIGPEKYLDDRLIARHVMKLVENTDRIRILDAEISPRVLKTFIKKSKLLIAERIHSLIGSVKVNTPFLAIGSNWDSRIHGIVEEMLDAKDYVFLLDYPKSDDLCKLFDTIWKNLPNIKQNRIEKNNNIILWAQKTGLEINKIIEKNINKK